MAKKKQKPISYKVEVKQLKEGVDPAKFSEYKYKEGYLVLHHRYGETGSWFWIGFTTPDNLKARLGEKQWAKFGNGKREFTIHPK